MKIACLHPGRVFALLFVCSIALPAAADEPAPPALDRIVVTGSKENASLLKTPVAISVVEKAQADRAKPLTIGDLLNQVPGVYVPSVSGNEQHNMGIRLPLSPNFQYLYLEDGIPIRPVGVFNSSSLIEYNLDGADRIEVIKGPSSSLYGNNAVGGAINVITRAPSATPESYAGVQGTSQGYRRVDAAASGSDGPWSAMIAGYHARRRDGWEDHSDFDKRSLTLRTDYALSGAAGLTAMLTSNSLHTQVPGGLTPVLYETRPDYSVNTFTYRNFDAQRLTAAWHQQWSEASLTTATVFLRHNATDDLTQGKITNNATDPTKATGRLISDSFTSTGIDLRHREDFGPAGSRVIAGFIAEHTPYGATETNLAITRDAATGQYLSYVPTTQRRGYDVDLRNSAPYAQAEIALTPALQAVAGGRYDVIDYGYVNNLVPSSTTGAPSETRTFRRFTPKLGATYDWSPALNFYANLSQGFIPPDITQLYGQLAVPNLRPARFTNYEVGSRLAFAQGRGTLEAALYRMDGREEIVVYNQTAGGVTDPRNAGKTLHEGIELGAQFQVLRELGVRAGATFAHHEYRDYQFNPTINYAGNELRGSPHQIVNAEATWRPRALAGLRAELEVQRVSGYWMNDANTVRYPGHTLLNLRTGYAAGRYEFWVNVLNLTDKHYAEIATSTYSGAGPYTPATQDNYTPGAPRAVQLGFAWHFGAKN